ncbi:MAG TPA: GAF domain-containing protein [Anaerolineales bacterium]|nr:GAF domain-containing protein [Anaerolineales bacterium]
MSEPIRILIVEDLPPDADLAMREIRKSLGDCVFQRVETERDYLEALDKFNPDLILSDYHLPNFDGMQALKLALKRVPFTPLIIITGSLSEDTAVDCVKAGASNYVIKENLKRLGAAVSHALEEKKVYLERKRAEEQLVASEAELRALFAAMMDVVVVLDADGRYIEIAPTNPTNLYRPAEGMLGKTLHEILPKNTADLILSKIHEALQSGQPVDCEYALQIGDKQIWFSANASPRSKNTVMWVAHDFTEHKHAEDALREQERQMRALVTSLDDIVFEVDEQGTYRQVWTANEELLPMPKSQLVGKTLVHLWGEEMGGLLLSVVRRVLGSGKPETYEFPLEIRERTLWSMARASPILVPGETPKSVVVLIRDITERKQAEEKILHLNRMYATISQINQVIVREKERHSLFSQICHVAIEYGKFRMAWIGLIEEVNGYVKPTVFAGDEQGYLTNISIAVQDPILGGGPTGIAIREGRCIICHDIASDPGMIPWRELALQRGYRSSASVPIRQKGHAIGALTVYASEPHGFSDDDQNLLDEIGRDISFALDSIDAEAERKRAEETLQESERKLKQAQQIANIGYWENDLIADRITGSEEAHRIFGLQSPATDLSRAQFQEMIHPDDQPLQRQVWSEALQGSRVYEVEYRIIRPDGDIRFVHARDEIVYDEGGRAIRVFGVIQDITERKQAEQAISQHLAELETLYENGLALSQLLSPKEIAQKLIELMRSKLNWHHTAVRLYHPEDESLELLAFNLPGTKTTAELQEAEQRFKSMISKAGEGLSGWAVQHHQNVRAGELSHDPRFVNVEPNIHSGLYILLKVEDRMVGVVSIESEKPDAFSEADERLTITLANQAAIALENGRLHEETLQHLKQLQALHTIDRTIAGSFDQRMMLDVLLTQTLSQLEAEAAAIFLIQPHQRGALQYIAGLGFKTDLIQIASLKLGNSLAGEAVVKREMIHVREPEVREPDPLLSKLWLEEGFKCMDVIPLISKGEVKGVMTVFHRKDFTPNPAWSSFLETLAGQAAIAIDTTQMFDSLQRANMQLAVAYEATIEGWSQAMDLRDKETEGHSQRVTEMTVHLGKALQLSDEDIVKMRRGALLHDIGKLGVPDRILLKVEKLTDEEWLIMKKHPEFAYDMLHSIAYLRGSLDIPYCHHEKWDGTGYPQGLKGEQIPLAARIFAIVDVWDALTSDRPYRKAWSKPDALQYIREQSGKHFDPKVVEVFLKEYGSEKTYTD